IGLKLVSVDCAQSICDILSPACQSRRPTKSKPDPWKRLRCSPIVNSRMRRMIRSSISASSDRLTKGSTSCSLVLMTMRIADCGLRAAASWNSHAVDDVFDHAVGRQPMARGVRPEPDAVAEDVLRQILDVFRVDLRAPADEQRPHL